jgi:hypothetical protein
VAVDFTNLIFTDFPVILIMKCQQMPLPCFGKGFAIFLARLLKYQGELTEGKVRDFTPPKFLWCLSIRGVSKK